MIKKLIIILGAIAFLIGCSPGSGQSGEGADNDSPPNDSVTVMDFDAFLAALQAEGAEAVAAGSFTATALSGEGRLIRINGQDLQVYEYVDPAQAAQEVQYINLDGGGFEGPDPSQPGMHVATLVDWIATPHFYHNGRLIVQYIGDNQEIIALLETVLGPQFAGGVSEEQLPLIVGILEPPEGAAMSFEDAALQATSVVLAEVTHVSQGPDYIGSIDPKICRPNQIVTLKLLKVFKGPQAENESHTIFLEGGVTDSESGCGDNPTAEKMMMIMEHDPLYEQNQRYLLALTPITSPTEPEIEAANGELVQLIKEMNPSRVLFNGRLYVEQGDHSRIEQAELHFPAYDERGRAVPGDPLGYTLEQFEQQVLAHQALQTFLTQMHLGNYKEAAVHFGGDFSWLREINPDLPADDEPQLLAQGCEVNGLVCLNVASIEQVSAVNGEFIFQVQFINEDGSLFVLEGCCGDSGGQSQDSFEFHVIQIGEKFKVQGLPPYRP